MQAYALASNASAPGSGNRVRVQNHSRHDSFKASCRCARFGLAPRRLRRRVLEPREARAPRRPRARRRPSSSAAAAGVTASGWPSGARTGSPSSGCDVRRDPRPLLHGHDARPGGGGADPRHAGRRAPAVDRSSTAPFTVRDGIGQRLAPRRPGDQTFGPGLMLKTTDVEQPQQLRLRSPSCRGRPRFASAAARIAGSFTVSVANGSAAGRQLRRRSSGTSSASCRRRCRTPGFRKR